MFIEVPGGVVGLRKRKFQDIQTNVSRIFTLPTLVRVEVLNSRRELMGSSQKSWESSGGLG